MNQNIKAKRVELIVFVISAVLISFLINFLTTYVYDYLHESVFFGRIVIVFVFILLITIGFLYLLLLSNVGYNKVSISAPITFSKEELRFIDLPFNFLSVQTRVNFDKLDKDGKKHLSVGDSWGNFFGGDFNKFLNQSIQASIVSKILDHWKFENKNETSFLGDDSLPSSIKNNFILKGWHVERGKIYAPFITNINASNPDNAFIEVQTKYGHVYFNWSFSYFNTPFHSKYFLGDELKDKVHDLVVNITLTYKSNLWKILSSNANKFGHWCEFLESELKQYDWKANQIDRILVLMKQFKEDFGK